MIPIFVPYIEEKKDLLLKKEYNASKKISAKTVTEAIEERIKDAKTVEEVVFYGESFSKLAYEKQEELLSSAYHYLKEKKIEGIRIITDVTNINKQFVKILKKYKVKTVELNAESSNNYILKRINKKYKFEEIMKAAKLLRWHRIDVHFMMMLGMPESTRLDEINTANALIKLKPKLVKIYPVVVIGGTKLAEEHMNGEYEPLTIVQAIERCKEITYIFNKKKINVIECSVEDFSKEEINENNILAGPYDKEFRKMVESNIWYDSIVEKIKSFNVKVKEVEIRVNSYNYESAVGYKKENIEKLKDLYNVNAYVNKDDDIKPGKLEVIIKKKFTDFLEEK